MHALLHDRAALAVPPAQRALIETAISSLVVAGDEVFKLRKPLALPFLDFSTAERRRADCNDELRLNRRTAAQLYLDVQPVTGTPDAPRIGGTAHGAIDWALRMRRFDDSERLDRLAERGMLDGALVDRLAGAIARFHVALPPSPAEFGAPEAARAWALENFDELQAHPACAPHAARLSALRAWTETEFARIAPRLAQRRASGFVREGHGDLHLANIVLVAGEPLLFDALEFNPALRHIDTAADLAFTFMDLLRHGLVGLAWRLADGYAADCGDYDGLPLLRFFAAYRALVRAKVALLRAAQDAGALAAFERDLALAEAIAAPRGTARLVATSGVSGSGKSTVAAVLVELLGAIRLRSDVERKRLHHIAPLARPTREQAARLYAADATARTYARLHETAARLVAGGVNVIVDAASLKRAERDALRALAAAQGARFRLVVCEAPLAVLRARVAARQRADDDPSDADLAVLERQLHWHERAADDEMPLRLDTDAPLDALRATLAKCFDTRG